MAFDLDGKVAVVTGAAGGIGLAVATRFADHGAQVALCDLRPLADDRLPRGARFFACDVSSESAVEQVFADVTEHFGKLDVVVNNAGITDLGGTLQEATTEYFDRMYRINVLGVMYGIKHGQRHMNDGGSIINTASLAAFYGGPLYGAYSMSKAAVVSLTRTAAIELGSRRIRVNAVCPGHTIIDPPTMASEELELVRKQCQVQSALGRPARVEDQTGLFHFLAADDSAFLTGQAIVVDGGFSLGDTDALYEAIAAAPGR